MTTTMKTMNGAKRQIDRTPLHLLCVFVVCLWIQPSESWLMPPSRFGRATFSISEFVRRTRPVSFSTSNQEDVQGVETISLASLQNHEDDGQRLAESIVAWLDSEWIPQEVHVKMAESAKASYVACREEGNDNDIMSIMTKVADDLTENWMEQYDKDSFVNAWDIANYVSDYLTQVSGNEGCDCSTPVY